MKKRHSSFLLSGLLCGTLSAAGAEATPRDTNTANTANYNSSYVEAQLRVDVDKTTDVVHFIRDNNDPRVITKTYVLKHADPYEIRSYLREMVQSKRVGNTSLQQSPPTEAANPSAESKVALASPAAQPGYTAATELGSNTAVECLKYADGTGILIVSAEDYRFESRDGALGIDELVAGLDLPGIASSSGQPKFLYFPGNVPARNLLPLIKNVGMNGSDVTELWQGKDRVAYDEGLNCLFFNVANYSRETIETLLRKYDAPIPEIKLKIRVYELYDENDDKIGVDFQAWKNNQGVDFFSVGGRFRDNWQAAYGGAMAPTGSERTSFYNFNPKWNSRYLDFLVSKGNAKIAYSGEISVRNNTKAELARKTRVFYMDQSKPAPETKEVPGLDSAKLLKDLAEIPVGKDTQQIVTAASQHFGFELTVDNASITQKETRLEVTVSNTSLIGFQSNGAPRISKDSGVSQSVSLANGANGFILGGVRKQELVSSSGGMPWLKDLPWVGYLFSTKSESVKHSQLVLVADCEWVYPESMIDADNEAKIQQTL